ncbi:MAG: tRNA threonylcarbamoyladenosine biosynthesis protein TsaE [Solirubrobacteraceae bacterium]|nr:tRNA threonylcarbamoyladenosine biosynthesis protein TsaE [Solirubrobacteraceae bacterium]
MTERLAIETHSEQETRDLGAALGAAVRAGDVLLLLGTFGVGKTTLVQGIARGLGIDGNVTSPSFVIANEYQGRLPLYHVDLYRVEEMDTTTLEALAEYFGGDGLCVVEWPQSVPADLIEHAIQIELAVTGENDRRLTLLDGPAHVRDAFATRGSAARAGRG